MPVVLGQGLKITGSEEADDRFVYPSVGAVLKTGGAVNGIMKSRIAPSRRYIGLQVYIIEEDRDYRFVGGITDRHFIPVNEKLSESEKQLLERLTAKLKHEGYLPSEP